MVCFSIPLGVCVGAGVGGWWFGRDCNDDVFVHATARVQQFMGPAV